MEFGVENKSSLFWEKATFDTSKSAFLVHNHAFKYKFDTWRTNTIFYYLDSGLCFGGLNPKGLNLFSFFFFFFSFSTGGVGIEGLGGSYPYEPPALGLKSAGAGTGGGPPGKGGAAPGGRGGPPGGRGGWAGGFGSWNPFPPLKVNHELTLPCLESSQFFAYSFLLRESIRVVTTQGRRNRPA